MIEQSVEVEFTVKVKYSLEEGQKFCEASAKDNLLSAIENERQNNALTPDDISADWIEVSVRQSKNVTPLTRHNSADKMDKNKGAVCLI